MNTLAIEAPSLLSMKVDLALAASRSLYSLDCRAAMIALARKIGTAILLSGGTNGHSPLLDCADTAFRKHQAFGSENGLHWHVMLGYWLESNELDPGQYFSVSYNGPFATITSRQVDGGGGSVSVTESCLEDLFYGATGSATSYKSWGYASYATSGFHLLLIDEQKHHRHGELVFTTDAHPCSGNIFFGNKDQEVKQLAAFLRLQGQIKEGFASRKLTESHRAQAGARAAQIHAKAGISFLPDSGFCTSCGSDVTVALSGIADGESITGCPCCGASWCD